MDKKAYKKPTLKKFKEVAAVCKGVVGAMSRALMCSRTQLYKWIKDDPKFKEVLDEYRGELLDECLRSARILCAGIPKLEGKKIVGWIERPDTQMIKYFISTLGREEGFGESIDITSKGESIKPDPIVIEVIDSRDKVVKSSEEAEE